MSARVLPTVDDGCLHLLNWGPTRFGVPRPVICREVLSSFVTEQGRKQILKVRPYSARDCRGPARVRSRRTFTSTRVATKRSTESEQVIVVLLCTSGVHVIGILRSTVS